MLKKEMTPRFLKSIGYTKATSEEPCTCPKSVKDHIKKILQLTLTMDPEPIRIF